MEEKLLKTLLTPDFVAWRHILWKEISGQAIDRGWVPANEIGEDGLIDPENARWALLYSRLVEIRYLFRRPVSRCVHAKFLHSAKGAKCVDVGYLSFHTSPAPNAEDKALFEIRKAELVEWRAHGGKPPVLPVGKTIKVERWRSPKAG